MKDNEEVKFEIKKENLIQIENQKGKLIKQNNVNSILKVSIDGHDSYNQEFRGTSASTPEYISDLIDKIIKQDIEEQSHNHFNGR